MDCYLSHSKPLKGTKTFHHIEIINYKIRGNLLSPGCPCHYSSANENKVELKFIKPECGKFYWVRSEFLCQKGSQKLKFYKKNDFEECLFIFLKHVSYDQNIHICWILKIKHG